MSCCFGLGNQLIKKQGEKTDRLFFHLAVWWLYQLLQAISVCLLFVKQNRQFVNIVNVHSLVLSTMYSNKKLRRRTHIKIQVLYWFACMKDYMTFSPVLLLRQSFFHSYHLLLLLCLCKKNIQQPIGLVLSIVHFEIHPWGYLTFTHHFYCHFSRMFSLRNVVWRPLILDWGFS